MKTYVVEIFEDCESHSSILFECEAENREHAQEQALNAYPECEIIFTSPKGILTEALKNLSTTAQTLKEMFK